MMRRTVIRLIAVLLVVNGAAGWLAVWAGWRASEQLLRDLRQASDEVRIQQENMVQALAGIEVAVGDAATTTDGFGRTLTQARDAVAEASTSAASLSSIFQRLTQVTQVTILGGRPLEGLTEPFSSSASEFERLSISLSRTGDVLADNARDVSRVAGDLRRIRSQVTAAATEVRSVRAMPFVEQSLAGLEMAARLLLGVVFFEATLSALIGVALFMMIELPESRRARRPTVPDRAPTDAPQEASEPSGE